MTERCVGKPWSPEEDKLLREAVAKHGEHDNWKAVAECVPGRTNKACRKRWLHSLSPNITKKPWTQEEDQKLLGLYNKYPGKWSVIARQIPGRTDDACSKRYREALDPTLTRGEWTENEDRDLLRLHSQLGQKWTIIGNALKRSGLSARNRYRQLSRQLSRRHGEGIPSLPSVPAIPPLPQPVHEANELDADWTHIPYPQFWPSHMSYASSSMMLQGSSVADHLDMHDPVFMPSPYSPSHTQPSPNDYYTSQSNPQNSPPPPFNFSSSSLRAALELPAVSPVTPYLPTPAPSQAMELSPPSYPDASPQVNHPPTLHPTPVAGPSSLPEVSNDLASLGSTIIQVPVPFPDDPPETSRTQEPIIPESQTAAREAASYPTPASSPAVEDTACLAAPSSYFPGQDPLRHYRTDADKAKDPAVSRRKLKDPGGPPRLSSKLPVTATHEVLAYACGYESCWPSDAEASTKCFATSRELGEHYKMSHYEDMNCEWPFRCGIEGCSKGWRSLNGLQYHLQISKAHFQQAVVAKLCEAQSPAPPPTPAPGSGRKRKTYDCTEPGCPNTYKQMSGLRYHLMHGHSRRLPTQLDSLPPELAKRVEEKIHSKSITTPP